MSQTSPDQLSTPEGGEASIEHLSKLVFLSYRFSQGGIGLQNRMLLYIENHFHEDFMSGPETDQVKERAQRMVGRFFLNNALHPATAVPWSMDFDEPFEKSEVLVTNELNGLFERFRDREQLSTFDDDIHELAKSVLVMDMDYLARPGGRGGDSTKLKIKVGSYARDAHDSLFVRYGLLRNSTNSEEYDEIFASISDESTIKRLDAFSLRLLVRVIDAYGQYHHDEEAAERLAVTKAMCQEMLHAR